MNAVQAQRYQAQAAAQAQAQHAQRAMAQAQAQQAQQAQAQAQAHLQARRISAPVDAVDSANRAAAAQQMSAEQQQQQRSAQALKRGAVDSLMGEGLRVAKRGRPTDRSLPVQLRGYVPESELHAQMRTLERQLDWNVSRKRAELLQSLQQRQTPSARRTLRLYLSNTVAGQTWQEQPHEAGAEGGAQAAPPVPTWTLKIEGRLLPLSEDEQPVKFSKLVKTVVVELERDPALHQDGGNVIKWEQTPESQAQSGVDGFEITRGGDAALRAKVHLYLASNREQFSLHPPLASLLDIRQGSRTEVMEALWAYIRDHKLLDEADRRVVKCDEALQQLFQAARLSFHHLPEMVIRLLQPVPPVVLEYWIRTDVPSHQADSAYDIEIDVDNVDYLRRAHEVFAGFDAQSAPSREIAEIDERIASMVSSVRNHASIREFMVRFASEPGETLQDCMSGSARDLEHLLGPRALGASSAASTVGVEELRRSETFEADWVPEAVQVAEAFRMAQTLATMPAAAVMAPAPPR